jgi:hypothetical protein
MAYIDQAKKQILVAAVKKKLEALFQDIWKLKSCIEMVQLIFRMLILGYLGGDQSIIMNETS